MQVNWFDALKSGVAIGGCDRSARSIDANAAATKQLGKGVEQLVRLSIDSCGRRPNFRAVGTPGPSHHRSSAPESDRDRHSRR